jgi:hypothetical protein
VTKKTPDSEKSFSEVQAERRARGGDSATLADREELCFRLLLERDAGGFNRSINNLSKSLDSLHIRQRQAGGGQNNKLAIRYPEQWDAAEKFCIYELRKGPFDSLGRLKGDPNRNNRYAKVMAKFIDQHQKAINDLVKTDPDYTKKLKHHLARIASYSLTDSKFATDAMKSARKKCGLNQ